MMSRVFILWLCFLSPLISSSGIEIAGLNADYNRAVSALERTKGLVSMGELQKETAFLGKRFEKYDSLRREIERENYSKNFNQLREVAEQLRTYASKAREELSEITAASKAAISAVTDAYYSGAHPAEVFDLIQNLWRAKVDHSQPLTSDSDVIRRYTKYTLNKLDFKTYLRSEHAANEHLLGFFKLVGRDGPKIVGTTREILLQEVLIFGFMRIRTPDAIRFRVAVELALAHGPAADPIVAAMALTLQDPSATSEELKAQLHQARASSPAELFDLFVNRCIALGDSDPNMHIEAAASVLHN